MFTWACIEYLALLTIKPQGPTLPYLSCCRWDRKGPDFAAELKSEILTQAHIECSGILAI
jgi:hypothetical protein